MGTSIIRRLTSAFAALVAGAVAMPITVGAQLAALPKPTANPPVTFAQARSDLPVDPAARFGRLPNGMTYVIYRYGTPPGTASVWMRVGAGSIMEQENQRGLAHFIEHMAFKGSKHVPEGDMVKLLERDGLKFGADTNAQTSHFQTVYTLNLPDASQRIVGDALFLLRETAGNVKFDPKAIDSERGVILGEERARSTVDSRASEVEIGHLLPGMTYAARMPIGLVEVINTAQRPAFMQFYNDFYRPEYTTVIVVGDVDADRVEADIRRRFSDWRPGPQSPAALTEFGSLTQRTAPEAKVVVAAGLMDTISVNWVQRPADKVETTASDVDDKLFSIAQTVLNKRLAHAAHAPACAFADAALQRQDVQHTARVHTFGIHPKDGQDRAAFEQAMTILREFLANGPTQGEVDQAISIEERNRRDGAAMERTIPSQAIAGLIVQALGTEGVIQSPSQGLAGFVAMKPALTVAAIHTSLKQIGFDTPPVLSRLGERAATFDEAAMLAAYNAIMQAPVTSFAARPSVDWPYTRFGPPSAVVSSQALPEVAATRVTFANGVQLTFKQTHFEDRAVHVAVQVGNGDFGIRADQGATLFMARHVGLYDGGLGKMSADDIGEALAGKAYGLNLAMSSHAAILSGTTTQTDLALQLQVLTAFITDAGLRPEALDRAKAGLPAFYANAATSPEGVYALEAVGGLYGDDPRYTAPTLRDALAVDHASLAALLRDQLGHGPVEVTIVGDLTLEAAQAQVGATLGAMPPLPAAVAVPGSGQLHFPADHLHRVYTHAGRADQNLSVIAWPTTDHDADPRRAAALELLAAVMTVRELDEVRGKQGATYSASVNSTMSRHFPGFGFLASRATVRPEVDDAYARTVAAIAAELKQRPVTPDELTRARLPMIDHLHVARNSNGYWLALLSGTLRDPRQLATAAAREQDLLSVDAQQIQSVAQTYLDMSKALRIQVKPQEPARP